MISSIRRLVLPVLLVAFGCAVTTCNSRTVQKAARLAGEEAAYAALGSALTKAGITSASRITDAVRLVVKNKDYGGAAAAFAVALNEHNMRSTQKLTSSQVVGLMRQTIPVVRGASPRVGAGLQGFCDYMATKG
jgi:hypothetical protein